MLIDIFLAVFIICLTLVCVFGTVYVTARIARYIILFVLPVIGEMLIRWDEEDRIKD